MRTSTSIVNWNTMVHWHSNVQSNLISGHLFCTKHQGVTQTCSKQQNPSSDSGCDDRALWLEHLKSDFRVQPQPSPPKETGHRRIWRQLLPSFPQKINQTTHVLWFRFFLPTLKENCKQDTEVWDVFGIRTVQRVVESGRAIGPKVFENLVILLGDPNPWYLESKDWGFGTKKSEK